MPTMQIVRRGARKHGYTIAELPGRGKGSHRQHAVLDATGGEVARFGLTDHPKELSWTVLRNLEESLSPLLGEHWLER